MKSSSKISPPASSVLIGKVSAAHGIKGAVRIESYADSLDLFASGTQLWIQSQGATAVAHTIAWVQAHGRKVRMAFEKVADRSAAETLIGAALYIDRARLPDLEEDTYYWFELIGLTVQTVGGNILGEIETVLPTGSNDVYVVKDHSQTPAREHLIPALATVVQEIDLTAGVMFVELPEGLL